MPTVNRRRLVQNGMVVTGGVLGASILDHVARPESLATGQSIHPSGDPWSFVPEGMLKPATEPADWTIRKDYPTETVEAEEPPENCVIKVFPTAENSRFAYSFVLRPEVLSSAVNQLLVQHLTYANDNAASEGYPGIEQDARDIFATMLNVPVEDLSTDNGGESRARYHFISPNGYCHALYIERRGAKVLVARATQPNSLPWPFLRDVVGDLFEIPLGADPAIVGGTRWHLSYGPIDFHPSAYQPPVCQ